MNPTKPKETRGEKAHRLAVAEVLRAARKLGRRYSSEGRVGMLPEERALRDAAWALQSATHQRALEKATDTRHGNMLRRLQEGRR